MPAYKKSFKPRVFKKKRLLKPKQKMTATKQLTKVIKAVMSKSEEIKSQADTVNNQAIQIYSAGSLSTYDCGFVYGNITQGTGAGNRIGNRISVVKHLVKGYVSIAGSTVYQNIYIRMICLRAKQTTSTTASSYAGLFQLGNVATNPTGTLLDMIRSINKDYFTVYYSRTVLLGSADGTTSSLAMNNTVGNYRFTFDLTKVFGGSPIEFNDTGSYPQNKACYLAFVPCNANGAVLTSANIAGYQFTIDNEVFYRDA